MALVLLVLFLQFLLPVVLIPTPSERMVLVRDLFVSARLSKFLILPSRPCEEVVSLPSGTLRTSLSMLHLPLLVLHQLINLLPMVLLLPLHSPVCMVFPTITAMLLREHGLDLAVPQLLRFVQIV